MNTAALFEQLQTGDRRARDQAFDRIVESADPGLLAPLAAKAEPNAPYWETLFCNFLQRMPADDALPHLRKLLLSFNATTRAHALTALEQFSFEQRLDLLLDLLVHPNQEVQLHAIDALGQQRCTAAIHHLARLLQLQEQAVVKAAFDALRQIDVPRAGRQLVLLLADASPWKRAAALEALGNMSCYTRWKRFIPCLDDAEPEVRRAAVLNLSRKADARANKYLVPALEKERDEATAKLSLNRLALYPEAAVVDVLIRTAANHENPQIRRATGWIIEEIDEALLRQRMLKLLPKVGVEVQTYILVKMGQRRLPDCGAIIAGYAEQGQPTRLLCAALEGLGFLGERTHLPKVVPHMGDSDPMTAYVATLSAVQLVRRLGDCPALVELLHSKDKSTVVLKQVILQYMIDALEWDYDDPQLLAALIENLQSDNENIAYLSIILLGRCQGRSDLVPLLLAVCDAEDNSQDIKDVARQAVDKVLDGDLQSLIDDLDDLQSPESLHARLTLLAGLNWRAASAEHCLAQIGELDWSGANGDLDNVLTDCARTAFAAAPEASQTYLAARASTTPWDRALVRAWLQSLGDMAHTREQADWQRIFARADSAVVREAVARAISCKSRWAVDALVERASRETALDLAAELRSAVRQIMEM